MSILPDVGIFGSDDIVAVEQATWMRLPKRNSSKRTSHWQWKCITVKAIPSGNCTVRSGPVHDYRICEKYGLGSRAYELVDVYPLQKFERAALPYTSAI